MAVRVSRKTVVIVCPDATEARIHHALSGTSSLLAWMRRRCVQLPASEHGVKPTVAQPRGARRAGLAGR